MPGAPTGLGDRIKRLRDGRGLTQSALAALAGIKQPHLSQIESGVRQDPQGSVLAALARALGVTVDELLREQAPQ